MPSASRMSTPVAVDEPEIEGRYAQLGGYTVSVRDAPAGPRPGARSSPDCPTTAASARTGASSPRARSPSAGPTTRRPTWPATPTTPAPGHLPLVTAGHAMVEFSPTGELDATMAVVMQNVAQAKAAS